MSRLINLCQIVLQNWFSTFVLPWLIVLLSFGINAPIFFLVGPDDSDSNSTGGIMPLFIFVFITYVQVMREFFPFALGLSVTRRSFFTAMLGLAALQAAAFALLAVVCSGVEAATGGWGVGLSFFAPGVFAELGVVPLFLAYALVLLCMMCLGMFIGVLVKRWGGTGLLLLSLGLLVVAGGAVSLITWAAWWPSVVGWFAAQSMTALTVLWPFVLTVFFGATSFAMLRRTAA